MSLINCTPHPIWLFRDDERLPYLELPPSGYVARLAMTSRATTSHDHNGQRVPVETVEYGRVEGLPKWETVGMYYVVSLPVGLACRYQRTDLLVPYGEVRDARGTVIGCTALASPVVAS